MTKHQTPNANRPKQYFNFLIQPLLYSNIYLYLYVFFTHKESKTEPGKAITNIATIGYMHLLMFHSLLVIKHSRLGLNCNFSRKGFPLPKNGLITRKYNRTKYSRFICKASETCLWDRKSEVNVREYLVRERPRSGLVPRHQAEHSLLLVFWVSCPGTDTGSRGTTRALYRGTGTNLNRFSSVAAVFTFSQAVVSHKFVADFSIVSTFS